MKESTSKEKILKTLRNALLSKTSEASCVFPTSSFYKPIDSDVSIAFADAILNSGSLCCYCSDENELREQLLQIVSSMTNDGIACYNEVFFNFIQSLKIPDSFLASSNKSYPLGIMLCENLIAQDGSITFTERQGYLGNLTMFPDVFVVLGFTSQVVDTYKASVDQIRIRYFDNPPKNIVTLNVDKLQGENRDISKLIILLVEDQL